MTHDVLQRLREADPLLGTSPPDPRSEQARAILAAVLDDVTVAPGPVPERRRRRTLVAALAAAVVALAAAAIAVTTTRVADPSSVACYDAASTVADTVVVASTANPVADCRTLWEQGDIDPAVTTADAVPDLVACVLDTADVVGVFPAGSCDDVVVGGATDTGLAPVVPEPDATRDPREADTDGTGEASTGLAVPDFGTDDETVRAALDEIRRSMLDRCLDLPAASRLVEAVLAEHGLADWTVEPLLDDHPEGACTGFFPRPGDRHVGLVPVDAPR